MHPTGLDHFEEAEAALNIARILDAENPATERTERYHLARAQAHATLALVAAIAAAAHLEGPVSWGPRNA